MAKKGTPAEEARPDGSVKKLRKLVKDVRVAMLTTVTRDGSLRSRPMLTSQVEPEGGLWFIAKAGSAVAEEISAQPRVNVSYANPKGDRYVSLSGTASLVRDASRLKELWSGKHKAWFPEGKKDPDLALVRVAVQGAEYWDTGRSAGVPVSDVGRAQPGQDRSAENGTGAGAQG